MQDAPMPLFDLTTAKGRAGWIAAHDLDVIRGTDEGLVCTATGNDPYLHSPLLSVPMGKPLWLTVRLKTTQAGMGQLFFFTPTVYATEENSVRFAVRAGRWEEVRIALPPLPAAQCHFRFDPPGTKGGTTVLASITLEPRIALPEPEWLVVSQELTEGAGGVTAGGLQLRAGGQAGHFSLECGSLRAHSYSHPAIGYQVTAQSPLKWVRFPNAYSAPQLGQRKELTLKRSVTDDEGGEWLWEQQFRAVAVGKIAVESRLSCTKERWLAHSPPLILVVEQRRQAILCGVEYLDAPDTSSSEADLKGEQALRHVPDAHTLTLPLMAVQHDGNWLGLAWEKSEHCVPLFDSPNRRFTGGGHLLGLLFPGGQRPPGKVMPHASAKLLPGHPLTLKGTLYAGRGESVLPAVQAWLVDHPLPPIPKARYDALTGVGWLDSGCAERGRFRHALPGEFRPQPAADAAMLLELLGLRRKEPRLRAAAREARALVGKGEAGGVGHIHTLGPALAAGGGRELLAGVGAHAAQALERFGTDGTIPYVPGKVDYGSTHFEKSANGLVAPVVYGALEAAMLSGEGRQIKAALALVRTLHIRWKNTVPRGAQTWEVPLHTPDILASGHLVKCAVLAYELSGEAFFLEMAKHWAWTGVPFTYLVHPNPAEEVGLYATTPVLGATGWIAPNWIGLPVQWCGLVYADALLDLARYETALWTRLAEGIVWSGVQQSFPPGSDPERQGLLPDSFNVVAQLRNDPAINPATVQVPLLRVLGTPAYSRTMLTPGVLVHAPGVVRVTGKRSFQVVGWPATPYSILVTGLAQEPKTIQGTARRVGYQNSALILEAKGAVTVAF